MEPTRKLEEILSRCERDKVTGVLRVLGAGQEGEIHFLSGVPDSVRSGALEGDEALARISNFPNPDYQASVSLPPMCAETHQAFPSKGELGAVRPVELMRYCEERCLTCVLSVHCEGRDIDLHYELGDLIRIDPDSDLTIGVLEATEGQYAIALPEFALPKDEPNLPHPAFEVAIKGLRPPPVGLPQLAPTASSKASPSSRRWRPPLSQVGYAAAWIAAVSLVGVIAYQAFQTPGPLAPETVQDAR